MTQLIIDSAFAASPNHSTIIVKLLCVGPGLKSALPPWYLTKHANIREKDEFLSWKTVKFLHAISPFSFQFATGLRITLQSRYEADEFFSSEAAKSLFHQLEYLVLDCRCKLRNHGSLVHFIQQFGLLKTCFLLLHGRYSWYVIMKIFQEIFSSTLIVRNHALTMSLVNSFEMWYMHDIDYDYRYKDSIEKEAFGDGGVFSLLISLMCDYCKQDNGRSFITFFDAIAKMIPRGLYDREYSAIECKQQLYMSLLPLLDLLQRIILNRDFKRTFLRSHSEKPFPVESATSPRDQVELKAAEVILRVVDWVLKSKNNEHVLVPFVQNYGHSFLCEFPRLVLDTSKDQNGEVYSYFSDGETNSAEKIDLFDKINRLMWLQFLHLVKNYEEDSWRVKENSCPSVVISLLTDTLCQSSAASSTRGSESSATVFSPEKANDEQIATACLELLRCKALHDLVDFSASAAGMPVSRLIEVLMHTLDNIAPSSSPSAFLRAHATEKELVHIAKISFECLLHFTPCEKLDHENYGYASDNDDIPVHTRLWGDLLDGLHKILFGWSTLDRSGKADQERIKDDGDDDKKDSSTEEDHDGARIFHMRIRQSFFGTETFDVVDEFLEWGETVYARSNEMLSDYEHDEVNAMTRRIAKWESYYHDRVDNFLDFVEGIVMPFFKKMSLEVVQAGDHFCVSKNNKDNKNRKLPRLTPSTKEKAARVASVKKILKCFKGERPDFKRINDECVEENEYHPGSGAV